MNFWEVKYIMPNLKNRSQFSSTLENDLLEKLKEISNNTKIPISKLFDKAIELLIEDMKNKGIYNN